MRSQVSDDKTIAHIDRLDFEIEPVKGNLLDAWKNVIRFREPSHRLNSLTEKNIDSFIESARFHLGASKNIYRIKGQLNERITAAFSDFYTYIVFDIVFVEYDNYMLMVVFAVHFLECIICLT